MKLRIKIIIFLLIVIGIVGTCFVLNTTIRSDISANIIQIWICVAVLISAIFVIYSYIQTNSAFVSSQKPHLLLQVRGFIKQNSQGLPDEHMTQIHYENKSNNPFYDLNILVRVSTQNTTVNLDNLFSPNMYMAVHDQRDRTFSTKKEIDSGFDLDAAVRTNQPITLSLEYTFSFNRRKEFIKVQEYVWKNNNWSIK